MLGTTFLLKESLNSSPKNLGRKENKKETNAETVNLHREEREEKEVRTEMIKRKDPAETDNKEKEEEKEDAAETDSDPTIA